MNDKAALAKTPLFVDLDAEALDELAVGLHTCELVAGEVLFKQGDPSEDAYILIDGTLRLSVRLAGDDQLDLGTAGAGQVLGELALVDRANRSATAVAETAVRAYRLPRSFYDALLVAGRPAPLIVLRRIAVEIARRMRATIAEFDSDGDGASAAAAVPVLASRLAPPRTSQLGRVIVLESGDLDIADLLVLPPLRSFSADELTTLLGDAAPIEFPRRHPILEKGGPAGTAYLVMQGALQPVSGNDERRVKLPLIGPGETAGEVALLDGQPQPVTVVSRERATVVPLTRSRLDELLDRRDPAGSRGLQLLTNNLTEHARRMNRRYTWFEADQRAWAR